MTNNETEMPSPEVCAGKIFEISGTKFDPDIAADLWPKILQHKWLMSEKLHRDDLYLVKENPGNKKVQDILRPYRIEADLETLKKGGL